ncbi:MAG: hypothetical protein J7647_01415 [Cyanobacteria bacterium SBLK]|nr:hypothetical protein [Cyanobacteria bacterium SBLK]
MKNLKDFDNRSQCHDCSFHRNSYAITLRCHSEFKDKKNGFVTASFELEKIPCSNWTKRGEGQDALIEKEIREFGRSIGIELPRLKKVPAHTKYSHGANILHELGHWAIVPDILIQKQKELYSKGYFKEDAHYDLLFDFGVIPSQELTLLHLSNEFLSEEAEKLFFCSFPLIDEHGVQEWCRQVAKKKHWQNVKRWEWRGTDPASQLKKLRIDIKNGIYRPPITKIIYQPKSREWVTFFDDGSAENFPQEL